MKNSLASELTVAEMYHPKSDLLLQSQGPTLKIQTELLPNSYASTKCQRGTALPHKNNQSLTVENAMEALV